ncbi:MAG: thiamine phosphate synthase [Acidimicrobiales bacterium]
MTPPTQEHPFLQGRRLYLCTSDREDLEGFLRACISGGVDVVQLRDKRLDDAGIVQRAGLAQRVCADLGVPFILNDRPDLAAEMGADGVHVGQDDVAAVEARRLLGEGGIVGLSTHEPAQLEAALLEPVDYVSVGPVVPTPTKPGRPGTGLDYVRIASRLAAGCAPPMPFFVTGNARPDTVGAMVAAGARRVVVVRWLTESPEPESAARQLAAALDGAVGRTEP